MSTSVGQRAKRVMMFAMLGTATPGSWERSKLFSTENFFFSKSYFTHLLVPGSIWAGPIKPPSTLGMMSKGSEERQTCCV